MAEALLEPFAPLSMTVADAGDEPLLEPQPGATPLWQDCRLEALFELDLDVAGLRAGCNGCRAQPDNSWISSTMRTGRTAGASTRWISALPTGSGWCRGIRQRPVNRLCTWIPVWPSAAAVTPPPGSVWTGWPGPISKIAPVLDYGCGSGILALAALKLGCLAGAGHRS